MPSDALPSPLDDPSSGMLDCPPLRWGMLSCGRVVHDFCQALKHLPSAQVIACAARSKERAVEFASKHGIPKAYGSYEELVRDPEIDIVYVGNVHSFRRSTGELCLNANKHVLLEKPIACTADDTAYLIQLARQKKLFLMEGMWTRFFPVFEQARQLVAEGAIGEVSAVYSDFNFNASDSEEYPSSFVYQRKLGGGATLLTGPYPVAAATAFFSQPPSKIHAIGQVDDQVDLQVAVVAEFPSTSTEPNRPKQPGCGVATLSFGMLCESREETIVVGTQGRLTIGPPGHCPTHLRLERKVPGRGNQETVDFDYPLPEDTAEIVQAGGFVYPNSAGFCYEAAAVARCIAAGKTEVPQYTLAETLESMKILQEIRGQLGLKDVADD